MSALNLNSPMGIIYIVLIIVGCLVGLFVLKRLFLDKKKSRVDSKNSAANLIEGRISKGGKRRKYKRQRK